MFGIFGKARKGDEKTPKPPAVELTADVEVELIKYFLEKRYGHKFSERVAVDGFIDDMSYRLVIDDRRTPGVGLDWVSAYGGETKNVLAVRPAFLDRYWDDVRRGYETDENDSRWDRDTKARCRAAACAGSRDEMLVMAAAEGLL